MNNKNEQSFEKLNGVFYTPFEIVEFLASWALSNIHHDDPIEILEPSSGDGRFIEKLYSLNKNVNITAIEINKEECKNTKKFPNLQIINDDFYNVYNSMKGNKNFDIVIGNPPYIRYQFLSDSQREQQSNILIKNKLKPNRLINAWVAFLVASIDLCKVGGKIAFVLPTDFLQVSYAKDIRKFVLKQLENITIIHFKNIVFSNIQQDVILLMGIKKNDHNEYDDTSIRNIIVDDLNQLSNNIENIPFEKYDFNDNDDKWRHFLLSNNFFKFYKKDFIDNTFSITDISTIEVGITTGNNKIFVIDDTTLNEYKLDKYKLPLLGRSLDVEGLYYTQQDIDINLKNNRNVWLLDFNNKDLNAYAKKYIKNIEDKNEHIGYKLSLRSKWYEIPSIWIPDAFLLRRIGNYPKIVKNNINATSTDTFHRLKIHNKNDINKLLVIFYSSVTLLSFELEGRIFGGGALEILPGDLKNIRLPIIEGNLDFDAIADKLDEKFRQKEDITNIVKWIDNIIQPFSKFTKAEMDNIYNTWNELRNNRIK